MKTLDLNQLVDLAQRLRQAFPDESPIVKRVEKAINKKLDECLSEGLTWDEAVHQFNNLGKQQLTVNNPGDWYVPGNLYVGGELTLLFNTQN